MKGKHLTNDEIMRFNNERKRKLTKKKTSPRENAQVRDKPAASDRDSDKSAE